MNKLLTTLFAIALGFGVTLPAYANHNGMGATVRCIQIKLLKRLMPTIAVR
jgi:hypothetical protein